MKKWNNWNIVRPTTPADDIPVTAEIAAWEMAYHLPSLTGTPRQIAWARLIRHQFLSNVFANLLDATAQLGATGAKAVFACVDELRGATDARQWIEEYRFRLGDPTAMVVAMPAMKAARRAEEERLKQEALLRDHRAAQNRKLAKEVSAWEAQHGLPEITGASTKQVNFARRCRFHLRSGMPEETRQQPVEAGYWIALYMKTNVEADVK